jgi:hypothetical protein
MRSAVRMSMILAAVALVAVACGGSSATTAPSATATSPAATPAPTELQPPPVPTNFRFGVVRIDCPDNPSEICTKFAVVWNSTSGTDTWFRIWMDWAAYGEACGVIAGRPTMILETAPGARSGQGIRQVFIDIDTDAVPCLWISAVNGAGESLRVQGRSDSSLR